MLNDKILNFKILFASIVSMLPRTHNDSNKTKGYFCSSSAWVLMLPVVELLSKAKHLIICNFLSIQKSRCDILGGKPSMYFFNAHRPLKTHKGDYRSPKRSCYTMFNVFL